VTGFQGERRVALLLFRLLLRRGGSKPDRSGGKPSSLLTQTRNLLGHKKEKRRTGEEETWRLVVLPALRKKELTFRRARSGPLSRFGDKGQETESTKKARGALEISKGLPGASRLEC